MNKLEKTGHIVFALPLLGFGINHLTNVSQMSGMVPSYFGAPGFWVVLTGIALIAAAVSLITGKLTKYAGLGIAAFMAVNVLTIHLKGMGAEDQMMKMFAMVSLMKDMIIAGGALIIAARAK